MFKKFLYKILFLKSDVESISKCIPDEKEKLKRIIDSIKPKFYPLVFNQLMISLKEEGRHLDAEEIGKHAFSVLANSDWSFLWINSEQENEVIPFEKGAKNRKSTCDETEEIGRILFP